MRFSQRGFTMLEMSIVLLIISTVIGGGAVLFAASLDKRAMQETAMKMAAIQKALLDYRRAYDRLPCPAQQNIVYNDAETFGFEDTDTNCVNGAFASSGNYKEGIVPVLTLKLSPDYVIDGWGSRILYAVDSRLHLAGAFTTVAITDTTTRMTIKDLNGITKSALAAYVILSHGRNRHGAYGAGSGICNAELMGLATERWNCRCAAAACNTSYDGSYYQGPFTQSTTQITNYYTFDDIVLYATRADLRGNYE